MDKFPLGGWIHTLDFEGSNTVQVQAAAEGKVRDIALVTVRGATGLVNVSRVVGIGGSKGKRK